MNKSLYLFWDIVDLVMARTMKKTLMIFPFVWVVYFLTMGFVQIYIIGLVEVGIICHLIGLIGFSTYFLIDYDKIKRELKILSFKEEKEETK